MIKDRKWLPDPIAEQILNKYGVPYSIEKIRFSSIHWKASEANHARLEKLDPEYIEDLARAMERGDEFQRIVVVKSGNQYIIAGGNHRARAAVKAGLKDIEAYVYETVDEYLLYKVPRMLNPVALAVNRNHKTKQAADEHFQFGRPAKTLAEEYGIPEKALNVYINTIKVRKQLTDLRIADEKLTDTHVLKLCPLAFNENVLKAAATLAIRTCMTSEAVQEMTTQIRKCPTEAKQIAFIEEKTKELDTPQSAAIINVCAEGVQRRTRFLGNLKRFENDLSDAQPTLNKLGVTDKFQVESVKERLHALIIKLAKLAGAAKDKSEEGRNRRTS